MSQSNLYTKVGRMTVLLLWATFFVTLQFSQLYILYAPLSYAPAHLLQLPAHGLILLFFHLLCTLPLLFLGAPRHLYLMASFLSVNTAFQACTRLLAFSNNRACLAVYPYLYLLPLAVTVAIELQYMVQQWKVRQRFNNASLPSLLLLTIAVTYFVGITSLPLYDYMPGMHLWLSGYLYYGSRAVLTAGMLFSLVCWLIQWGKSHSFHIIFDRHESTSFRA